MKFTIAVDDDPSCGDDKVYKDNMTVSSITDVATEAATTHSTRKQLYGRDQEITTLREALQRVSQGSSEVGLVRGASGTGKSALVETLRCHVVRQYNGFYVSGKFDQMHQSDPFSALTACFSDLCDLIIQSDEIQTYRKRISAAIGAEINTLESLIPNLYQVMGTSSSEDGGGQSHHMITVEDRGKAFARFHHLCRSFLQAVAIPEHPIVLFLDDLQWSDSGSTEILCQSLIRNLDSQYILLVVAFRNDEESLNILSRNFFQTTKKTSKCLPISDIEVKELDIHSINALLMCLTGYHSLARMQALGELVLAKTHGNIYFVRQFLGSLQYKQLMVFDQETKTYSWDITKIKAETDISENVLQLVTAKIHMLSPALQQVLIVAAFLGFAFDVRVLQALFSSGSFFSDSLVDKDTIEVSTLLQEAAEEGMVEEKGMHSNEFKFSHDRVQQALYAMVSNDTERKQIHLSIGRLVGRLWEVEYKNNPTTPDTWKLFVACDQFNSGSDMLTTDEEKIRLVRLNLRTAKVALEKSALLPAAEYLQRTRQFIEIDQLWKADYNLSLDLYSTAAEIEYSLGNFDMSKALVNIVLEYAICSTDSIRANFTMISSLGGQGKFDLALELAIDLLQEMGEKFPKKPHSGDVVRALVSTKVQLFGRSDDKLMSLPVMEGDEQKIKMRLVSLIYVHAHFRMEENILLLSILRMVTMTLKYGISDSASLAFALYGFLLSVMGKRNAAYRFGRLSLALRDRQQSPQSIARGFLAVFCFINHYRNPVHEGLDWLKMACQKGNTSGEIALACLGALSYIAGTVYIGKSLPVVALEVKALCEQFEDLGQDDTYILTVPFYQAILNLMGESVDPTKLTGDAMVDEEIYSRAVESENIYASHNLIFVRLLLAAFFAKWDLALLHVKMMEPAHKSTLSHFNGALYMFLKGMTYLATCYDRRARVEARRSLKFLERLMWEGAAHVEPFVLILRAEEERLKGSVTMREAYDKAIASAARHNLPHHEALANERAGLSTNNDREYLARAYELYNSKWGAFGKAKNIKALLLRAGLQSTVVHEPAEHPEGTAKGPAGGLAFCGS